MRPDSNPMRGIIRQAAKADQERIQRISGEIQEAMSSPSEVHVLQVCAVAILDIAGKPTLVIGLRGAKQIRVELTPPTVSSLLHELGKAKNAGNGSSSPVALP